MAETWTSSRQALLVSIDSMASGTERSASTVAGIRTYTETLALTSAYQWGADSRYALCVGIEPTRTTRRGITSAILVADSTRRCSLSVEWGIVRCITAGVSAGGPVILQYPKYFQAPSVPPDFDIVFRVWSEYPLDRQSLVVSIASNGKSTRSYGPSAATFTALTEQITEIRVVPADFSSFVGETVVASVALQDTLGRNTSRGW